MSDLPLLPSTSEAILEPPNTLPAELPELPVDLLSISTSSLTAQNITTSLASQTDTQALETCVTLLLSRRIDDGSIVRTLVDAGLERGQAGVERAESRLKEILEGGASGSASSAGSGQGFEKWSKEQVESGIEELISSDQSLEVILRCTRILKGMKVKLDTFDILFPPTMDSPTLESKAGGQGDTDTKNPEDKGDGMDLDDPWADNDNDNDETIPDDPWEEGSIKSLPSLPDSIDDNPTTSDPPPVDLPTFITQPVPSSAMSFASSSALHALRIVFDRHGEEIFPFRFGVLEALPVWVNAGDLQAEGLLPGVNEEGRERPWSPTQSSDSILDRLPSRLCHAPDPTPRSLERTRSEDLVPAQDLSNWYKARINQVDSLGLLDVQIAWVQHGASLGVPNLDALGEDLSLLSRLIYDTTMTTLQNEQWNLKKWSTASSSDIVKAYLGGSTSETIVGDIKRLVLPYLYVLESRAERAGQADPNLIERLLHESILSLPLDLSLPIFESSKATLPATERLIKNDLNVARLALACLYGSDQKDKDVWKVMSSIFECLPVWDVSGGDLDSDKEATSTTLESIANFVRPTVSKPKSPKANDLFVFFSPLPFASLSRALDILDVHLESGEILARWDVGVQLRFLLQSSRDGKEQMELTEKIVRRLAGRGRSEQTEARWWNLWSDMLKLNGGEDALLRGAFGMLSVDEMMKIYLGGLLSSGRFDTAKKIVKRLEVEHQLSATMLEEAVLTTSREFYMNAESGNLHTGEMKLAYDCLAIAPHTTPIRLEKDFIEATSRLVSFKSLQSSSQLSPIEIRHTKDKLSLISKLLSSSDDAFRHFDMIIELADKLGGYQGDKGMIVEVLGMLVDTAIGEGEMERAFSLCERCFDTTKTLIKENERRHRKRSSVTSIPSTDDDEDDNNLAKVKNIAWKACLSLGQQSEYPEIDHKLTLIGRAIELCPPEQIPEILKIYRKLENGQMKLTIAAKRRRETGTATITMNPSSPRSPSRQSKEEERVLGSRTAARAARLALDLSSTFNLRQLAHGTPLNGIGSRSASADRGRDDSEKSARGSGEFERLFVEEEGERERVRTQAKRALAKGVGWLLGAEEGELGV